MDVSDLTDRLLFAIPKKGRLHEQVLKLLEGSDIQFVRKNRLDVALSTNQPLALVFLPAHDIAKFVGEGNVDLGITGQDMVAESGAYVEELLSLGFGSCSLSFQAPLSASETIRSPLDLVGKRIVTSFPYVVSKYFAALEAELAQFPNGYTKEQGEQALKRAAEAAQPPTEHINHSNISTPTTQTRINYVSGSVEAACALGLADGIVDLVESGETMRAAKLHAIGDILRTQAVLVCNPNKRQTQPLIGTILRRIQGVIAAQRYVLCNYNIHRSRLPEAIKITPGNKAPTISNLEDLSNGVYEGWVAVSSMIEKKKQAEIMDQLDAVGASDILVFNILNSRVV
ncbi:uncharacterized protein BJ171DRAFT_251245 [Polychytrium aggregatum]|uniref:uncharacterized protein n=1 Tax=Polychytrium aggregatum TaxID=110093 RepID=UPI0022FE95F7|nr:uncharacterized protein BJ171DRAFT_251245 [Polychytrium aggregatum]KAI9193566.1 hypothetical protein BJ171DRAFT_251245 [Polychytrium aggregatum]